MKRFLILILLIGLPCIAAELLPMTVAAEHEADGDVMGSSSAVIASDGTFTVLVDGVLEEGEAFHIYYFADVDGDAHCDLAEGDEVWEYDLHTVEGDEVIAVTYAAGVVSQSCDAFADTAAPHTH